jgi:hypothetical protein
MAITYHAGRRIQATSTDFAGTPAVSGGWKEVGRTTLGSAGSTIDVSSIPDKRYYQVLLDFPRSGSSQNGMRFNNDSGSNYSRRYTYNGASDTTATSETSFDFTGNGSSTNNFSVMYIANLAGKEKLIISNIHEGGSTGAGNIGDRREQVSKWANTSNALDQLTAIVSANNYASGAELVVLGYDPDDTHTTNFWEELATATISSAGELDTGSFTAKKYLWIQYSCNSTDGGFGFRFNSDTGTNYARRFSQNGASDQTELSYNMMRMIWSGANTYYGNMFIINNSANEKLVINHQAGITATGAGTSPYRWETAGKWANTSSQITSVQFLDHADASGFIDSGTVKVWGSN